jgi:transposase InsO family protein
VLRPFSAFFNLILSSFSHISHRKDYRRVPHLCPGLPPGWPETTPFFLCSPLWGSIPGEDKQIDFTHRPAHTKFKYLLTLADTFSGWVETCPTTGKSADMVFIHLINDIILHFGLPQTLQSDNIPAFISKVTQIVSSTLGVVWNLNIPYHPQSSGKVERVS